MIFNRAESYSAIGTKSREKEGKSSDAEEKKAVFFVAFCSNSLWNGGLGMNTVDAKKLCKQGCAVAKVKFSHDIDETLREQFNELSDELPGKKSEHVEAMILAFKSLPGAIQEQILSKRPEVRAAALALLAAIGVTPRREKPDRGSDIAKAG